MARKAKRGSEVKEFAEEFRKNLVTLLISVAGLGAAITWADVINTLINELFEERSVLTAKMYVATIVTIATLVVTYLVSKLRKSA